MQEVPYAKPNTTASASIFIYTRGFISIRYTKRKWRRKKLKAFKFECRFKTLYPMILFHHENHFHPANLNAPV